MTGSRTYNKDTLIVFTTCNHIDMTVLALEYLKHSVDVSDLVIVDDFSIDGTGTPTSYFLARLNRGVSTFETYISPSYLILQLIIS